MAGPTFQALPGFRDFIPRECAVRNYLFETWRAVARRCGYAEYESPILEDTALYLKKSGGELSGQLFRFEDQGGRDVTLRSIVRGLAYYTGVVFEVFDAKKSMRAVAGGGRYDTLVATISDGAVDLPATGFAMGDYVIRNLIEETTHAAMRMEAWLQRNAASCEVFVVVADETKRAESLKLVTDLRRAGIGTEFALTPAKVAKQFQSAERSGARFALIVGAEFPDLKLKVLASRAEESGTAATAIEWLTDRLQQPDGPLLA